ncbi:MAG: DPP IV N-terminal domain-containing protein [Prevotella sp.]|nr:DPP IV N-terminal domain-containing protein [Prevotella sp.]
MRKIIMIAMTLLAVMAADAKKLELKDLTGGMFRPQSMDVVQPMADGESFVKMSNGNKRIVKCSFKTGEVTQTLFDAETAKGDKIDRLEGFIMSPDGRRILLQTQSEAIYRHSFTATYYIYDIRNNRAVPLSENGKQQTPLFSPDGQQIAFVRDNNIFLVKLLYDNAEVQVTKDGKKNEVINGIPDWVNEEEFSHTDAMVFTANSEQLVWVRYDESQVKEYSLPLCNKPHATYKYPFAGDRNSTATVWSYDIKSKKVRQLQVPMDEDGYVPRLKAVEQAPEVAVYTLNRHQDCLRIFMVNALSTVAKQVIEEKVDKYIREEVIEWIQLTPQHILLPSDRDGNMHLYLYNMNGQLLRQVDSGDYEVSAVYGYDEKTGNTYFASHEAVGKDMTAPRNATEQHIWVARENGKKECLTPQAGWHKAVFSSGYQWFVHTWSDMNTPTQVALCDNKGKVQKTLIDNKELKEKLADYDLGRRELLTLTTADGVTLNAWMIKPADFDATKKYPVVMYQYGGPGNQQVRNDWGIGICGQGAIMEQYLCQQGFVCVCVDNRGTGGRGVDFEKCTYLRLGELEAHDQVEAALWLGQQPFVDKERIAIWGWSFGGFNTLMSMSEGREVFRCGIAIAPPTSWRFYDTVYTERYMRTPQENPNGYDDNPITRAGKLHGALLLCHGLADDNVHYRNTAEYTDALIDADKDYQQLVYSNRNHSIYGGNTRNHLFRQCVKFLKRECQRPNS